MEKGILPPRRKYSELPKYIYHIVNSKKEGYEIRNHPKLKQRQFVSKKISLKENLQKAIAYIKDENNPENQKTQNEINVYNNLPRYVRHIVTEKYQGFEVKDHPTLKNKKWTSMKITMEEKLKLTKEYLEESSETKRLSVNLK